MAILPSDKIVRGGDLITIGSAIKTELAKKQDTLVSGTDIKTINRESLLGPGDIRLSSLSSFKGFYNSSQSLSSAIPNPETGDYAYVKNTGTPATATIYAANSGQWENTGVSMAISDMESVFTTYAKLTLLSCLEKVAWVDANGESYINELRAALMGTLEVGSISASFSPGENIILDTMSLDDLKEYLTVTAEFSDGTEQEINGYQLTGTISEGTNTITVSFLGESDTFTVTAVHNYAAQLNNWIYHPWNNGGISRYYGGAIELRCGNSYDESQYNVWAVDGKKTLWSSVNGKTLKIRFKVNDISLGSFGVGIYQSSSITSLGNEYAKRAGVTPSLGDDGYYEATIECDIANFTYGSLSPGSSSTFGMFAYSRTTSASVYVYDVQITEVGGE